jgi:hypothetical protein
MRATSTLLLAAQLLALGHLLIVRHTICPEHGEAIHSESPQRNSDTGFDPPGRGSRSHGLAVGAPTAEHAHDHCLALANTRERFALLPAPDLMPGPLLVAQPCRRWQLSPLTPAVSVLLLAPKNSPPWA